MPDTWQTIEQAAVTLGLSVRTVNRHITAGKLESRLFEGRREVRVNLPDPVPADKRANGSRVPDMVAEATTPAMQAASVRQATEARASTSGASASTDPFPSKGSFDTSDTPTVETVAQASAAQDPKPARQTVTAEVVSDKPLDLQTMLALADSIDDKASLAVVAYQTLARTADAQVQSLRKVAYGAWAVVGVMAACIIVAVGWTAHRLTSAEGDANRLQQQVSKQDEQLNRLLQEKEAAQTEMYNKREEAAVLHERNQHLVSEVKRTQATVAEQQQAMAQMAAAHLAGTTRPTTAPSATGVAATPSPASAATQPAGTPAAAGIAQAGTAAKPTTYPARPVSPPNSRATYSTNSAEAFDPK